MSSPAEQPCRKLLHPARTVFAIGGMFLASALILSKPGSREDSHRSKLIATIGSVLQEHWTGGDGPLNSALAAMPLERLTVMGQLSKLPPRERLGRIFDPNHPVSYDSFAHCLVLATLDRITLIPPDEGFQIVTAASGLIPNEVKLQLLTVLGQNAMAAGYPTLAFQILRDACRCPGSTWNTVSDMAVASHGAKLQRSALDEVRMWLARDGAALGAAGLAEAQSLGRALAMKLELPDEAAELCIAVLKSQPAITEESAPLIERAYRAAVLADRTSEMLPWIESFLATFPEARQSWRDLLAFAKAGHPVRREYRTWMRRAADIADSNSMHEKAWSWYERLVAAGEMDALDRFVPLADQLDRSDEAAEIVSALIRVPGHERTPIRIARVFAENGCLEYARGIYEEWVRRYANDRAALFELACLLEQTADSETATRSYEELLRRFPGDAPAIKRLARLRIHASQPHAALRDLNALRDSEFDAETLKCYTALAESLDRPDTLLRALRITSREAEKATPDLYLRMYEAARQMASEESSLSILREGVARMPDRPSLRMRLGHALMEMRRYDEAVTEMLHSSLSNRCDAMSLAIAAAARTSRFKEVLAIVGENFEIRNELPMATRLDLAMLCMKTGDTARAESLFRSVPEDRWHLARLAEARMMAGQFQEAERLARRNLSQTYAPKSDDWILLGDAQNKLGKTAEANEAYGRALTAVAHRLARESAHQPVASAQPAR